MTSHSSKTEWKLRDSERIKACVAPAGLTASLHPRCEFLKEQGLPPGSDLSLSVTQQTEGLERGDHGCPRARDEKQVWCQGRGRGPGVGIWNLCGPCELCTGPARAENHPGMMPAAGSSGLWPGLQITEPGGHLGHPGHLQKGNSQGAREAGGAQRGAPGA